MVEVEALSTGFSPRSQLIDRQHVEMLAEMIDALPPIIVHLHTMMVIDGAHRLEVFRKAGRSHIPAFLFKGSEAEALVVAVRANIQHGKPLSQAERQAAAAALLQRCPERSDRSLGEICGLSHTTVARIRRAAFHTGVADTALSRIGRDGRSRPVDPAVGQAHVQEAMKDHPSASIRDLARTAGVSPSTVQRTISKLRQPQPAETSESDGGRRSEGSLVAEPDMLSTALPSAMSVTTGWLTRTAVSPDDVHVYLEDVPLARMYDIADECRKRAKIWADIAVAVEKRTRSRRLPEE